MKSLFFSCLLKDTKRLKNCSVAMWNSNEIKRFLKCFEKNSGNPKEKVLRYFIHWHQLKSINACDIVDIMLLLVEIGKFPTT